MKLPEMTNDECRLTNGGIASLSRFNQTEYIIRCSVLDVRCSTFISFYHQSDWPFFGRRPRSYETLP
ncbi:hypothetical protein D1AOALGA4SA_4729 [Olavius algarvensis Delta 1 endosymbiont]|nr:hypothetical protein D1AOALGA4SA_4729 [Olavius algarvensis Delta 1 endosymbiont]